MAGLFMVNWLLIAQWALESSSSSFWAFDEFVGRSWVLSGRFVFFVWTRRRERERASEQARGRRFGFFVRVILDNFRVYYGVYSRVRVIDNFRVGCVARGRRKEGDRLFVRFVLVSLYGGYFRSGCSGGRARQRVRDRGLSREFQEEEERILAIVCRFSFVVFSFGIFIQRNQVVVVYVGVVGDNIVQVVGGRYFCIRRGRCQGWGQWRIGRGDLDMVRGLFVRLSVTVISLFRLQVLFVFYMFFDGDVQWESGGGEGVVFVYLRQRRIVGRVGCVGRAFFEQARFVYLKKGFFRFRRLLDLEFVWFIWVIILMSQFCLRTGQGRRSRVSWLDGFRFFRFRRQYVFFVGNKQICF